MNLKQSFLFGLAIIAIGALSYSFNGRFAHYAYALPNVTYTVNTNVDAGDSNIGDGVCQTTTGHCSLRAAIQEANASFLESTIILPTGSYDITLEGKNEDSAVSGDLDILSHITLQGEDKATTIIDANQIDRAIHVQDSGDLTISNVTITNGNDDGGAILNNNVLTITNSILTGNWGQSGGAIYSYRGSVSLDNVLIEDNSALSGGAIRVEFGNMNINNSVLRNNSARGGGALRAGQYCYSTPTDITINNSLISGNIASDGYGGGILQTCGDLIISNSTVMNNTSDEYGGGIAVSNSIADIVLDHSVINGNYSRLRGGGAYLYSANANFINSTISSNLTAGNGGALYVDCCSTVNLTNTTIANNIADDNLDNAGDGGGVYNSGSSPVFLQNTIMAGNIDRSIAAVDKFPECWGTFTSQGHNLIGNNFGCSDSFTNGANNDLVGSASTPIDARLQPLQNNGGPAQTHALLPDSPALDAADNSTCPATDQRGANRPFDGDGNGVAICDIGAYEGPVVDLSISLTMEETTVSIGQTVTYELFYANLGTETANNVTITNIVPDILHNVSYTSSHPGISQIGTDNFIWSAGSLAPGESGTIQVHGTVSNVSTVTTVDNSASINSDSGEDQFAGNDDSGFAITILPEAKVFLPIAIGQ